MLDPGTEPGGLRPHDLLDGIQGDFNGSIPDGVHGHLPSPRMGASDELAQRRWIFHQHPCSVRGIRIRLTEGSGPADEGAIDEDLDGSQPQAVAPEPGVEAEGEVEALVLHPQALHVH